MTKRTIKLDEEMTIFLDEPVTDVIHTSDKVVTFRKSESWDKAEHFIITTETTTVRKYLVRGRNAINAIDTLLDPEYKSINLSRLYTSSDVHIEPITDDFTIDDLKRRYPDFE